MSQFSGYTLLNRRVSIKQEKSTVNKTKPNRSSIEGENQDKERELRRISPKHKVKLKSTTTTTIQAPSQSKERLESHRKKPTTQTKCQTSISQKSIRARTKTDTGTIPKQIKTDGIGKSVKVPQTTGEPVKSVVGNKSTSRRSVLASSSNKPNAVLDTYHNVTIASPPPKVKHFKIAPGLNSNSAIEVCEDIINDTTEHSYISHQPYTQSRNSVLQKDINPYQYIEGKPIDNVERDNVQYRHDKSFTIKQPISFEINFEQGKHVVKAQEQANAETKVHTPESDNNDNHYSDDFESYESDFETASSTPTSENNSIILDNTVFNEEQSKTELPPQYVNQNDTNKKFHVISAVDKESKLDSGSYEINVNTKGKLFNSNHMAHICNQQVQLCDSLEGFSLITSEQFELDSGISGYENQISRESMKQLTEASYDYCVEVYYEGYTEFYKKPFQNLRSSTLLSKIQFDILDCTLLDMKPMGYELFMQVYGNLYSKQESTQTHDDQQENEIQTDIIPRITKWTQHPSLHDNLCWGDVLEDNNFQIKEDCKFDISIKMLKELTISTKNAGTEENLQLYTSIKLNKLKSFLRRASVLVSQCLILNQQNDSTLQLPNIKNFSTISQGFYCLKTNFINGLKVTKVFSNPRFNLLITVHECIREAEHHHFNFVNLLMVWSCSNFDTPIRLLNTWSEVSYIEISNASPDIVVSALRDGNIALWDLNEIYPYTDFSLLDGHVASFPASQTVMPNWPNSKKRKSPCLIDLGACIDIRSFQHDSMKYFHCHDNNYPDHQFVSLHDTGILTVWTLIKYTNKDCNALLIESKCEKPKQFDETFKIHEEVSPWSNCKLIQTAITNLRDYLEINKHIPTLFQKNVSNDEMLMELSEKPNGSKCSSVHFNCLDVALDDIYVCTDQQFVVVCTRTLKWPRFKRIPIPENYNVRPVFIKLLHNEHFLVVGFCNAAVIILNCEYFNTVKSVKNIPEITSKNNAIKMAISANTHANVSPINTDTSSGKSCRMQNIILNERKPSNTENYYEMMHTGIDAMPSTASLYEFKQKFFDININDHQLILPGLTSRTIRHAQDLHVNVCYNEGQLFTITNGIFRIYDFRLQKELQMTDNDNDSMAIANENILNVTIAKNTSEINYLILLNEHDVVQVHKLKN